MPPSATMLPIIDGRPLETNGSPTHVHEPARRTPVLARAQVVVLGGGPSGIAAATAAARAGADTLLIERYGFLGGMGTAAGVTSFCGFWANHHGELVRIVGGVGAEVLARLETREALRAPHSIFGKTLAQAYDNAAYKCVADELVNGSGARILFHALGTGVVVEDGRVTAIFVETKSGRGAVLADVFVDASGDGDLCANAGAAFDQSSDELAYPTLMFRMGGVDTARALAEGKPNLRALMMAAEASGDFRFPRRSAYINPQPHDGEWRANVTQLARPDGRAVDATRHAELSDAELEGRRQVDAFFRFLTSRVPGFENAYLLEIAPQLGIRETRRIRGAHVLSVDDVLSLRDFEDNVGLNGWPVEKHVRGDTEWTFLDGRGYHQLPWRMLVVPDLRNVLVAGRCASATHDAQASIRVSGPCFVMGEAAGLGAAVAARDRVAPAAVDVAKLQERLLEQGATLEVKNDALSR